MATTAPASSLPRGRRYVIRALLVTGTILAVLSIFAVFANRQLLNADNWSDTSSALLEDPAVRTQVSAFLTDQLYANVDVQGEVRQALPPRLAPLAGPAANALRDLTQRTTNRALGRPRVQEAWATANKLTAEQFINIAEGDSKAITQQGNAVVLDLRAMLLDLVQRIGLPGKLAGKVPPSAGKVKIMDGDQVSTLQNAASTLKGFALILPILSLGMLALAVGLGRGRRRHQLMIVGVDLIVAGTVVLVARNVIGGAVVDSLAQTEAVRPAAEAVWSIGTEMLRDVAGACVIGGIPIVFAAWLAGGTSPATSFRRFAAPWLRERPGGSYAVLAAIVLLILAWGPIPATRMVIPVLIMIGLAILGMEALRRQTAVEFPDATLAGRSPMRLHLPRRERAAPPPTTGEVEHVQSLERLADLHARGALSDDEFAREKDALKA